MNVYAVKHLPSEPAWSVLEISPDGSQRVIVTEYGDHCDANERRYARERANNTARTLARKHNGRLALNWQPDRS